jgi:hypothetical protein
VQISSTTLDFHKIVEYLTIIHLDITEPFMPYIENMRRIANHQQDDAQQHRLFLFHFSFAPDVSSSVGPIACDPTDAQLTGKFMGFGAFISCAITPSMPLNTQTQTHLIPLIIRVIHVARHPEDRGLRLDALGASRP